MKFVSPPAQTHLLPVGALPPRFIIWKTAGFFGYSHERVIWIHPNTEATVVPGVLSARHMNGVCEIIPHTVDLLLINGQPLIETIDMTHGDLIHDSKKLRVFFDADPAASFRHEFDELEDTELVDMLLDQSSLKIKITPRIERQVRITIEGMSLDGGLTFFRWQDIACIAFDEGRIPFLRRVIRLYVTDPVGGMSLASELPGLTRHESRGLLLWLENCVPLYLPYRWGILLGFAPLSLYDLMTVDTIIDHATASNQEPFISHDDLIPRGGEAQRSLLMVVVGVLLLGMMMGLHSASTAPEPSDTSPLEAMAYGVIVTPIVLVVFGIILAVAVRISQFAWNTLNRIFFRS